MKVEAAQIIGRSAVNVCRSPLITVRGQFPPRGGGEIEGEGEIEGAARHCRFANRVSLSSVSLVLLPWLSSSVVGDDGPSRGMRSPRTTIADEHVGATSDGGRKKGLPADR